MGTFTLDGAAGAGFQSEVRFGLDNRDSTDLPDGRVNAYINWAYNHIARPDIYRHRELQATQTIALVAGTQGYTLSPIPNAIFSVRNTTEGRKIYPLSGGVRTLDEGPTVNAEPTRYTVWGNQVLFYGTPTATEGGGDSVTVRYWQAPTPLSGSAATALRYEWDEVIISGAIWRGWKALNQQERAMEEREHFASLILEAQNILKVELEDTGWNVELDLSPYEGMDTI